MIPPYPGPAVLGNVNIELGNSSEYQLYDLANDPGERENLAGTEVDTLQAAKSEFSKLRGTAEKPVEEIELQ
jgi:hypothetical protein